MENAIVITSIAAPTESVQAFGQLEGWRLWVVADRKTPVPWKCSGAELISVGDQEKLPYRIAPLLPWNHYARKMVGYLRAMEAGAGCLADTDDDNRPYEDWGFPPWQGRFRCTPEGLSWVNVYSCFTDQRIWPRGFPLECIRDPASRLERARFEKRTVKVGIWQGLADGDPDVDAVYRMTVGRSCRFEPAEPLVLGRGSFSPFNSQNTLFQRKVFPLLYLPAFVSFRFTDILRGWVAQPILWRAGYRLGFTRATVLQVRNPHDYLEDFKSEIPVYFDIPVAFHGIRQLTHDPLGSCHVLNILGMLSGGELALCGIGTTIPELIYGHIAHDDLRVVWAAAPGLTRLRSLLPAQLEGVCGQCLHRDSCLGACVANNYHETGRLSAAYRFCAEADGLGLFPASRRR